MDLTNWQFFMYKNDLNMNFSRKIIFHALQPKVLVSLQHVGLGWPYWAPVPQHSVADATVRTFHFVPFIKQQRTYVAAHSNRKWSMRYTQIITEFGGYCQAFLGSQMVCFYSNQFELRFKSWSPHESINGSSKDLMLISKWTLRKIGSI